MLVCHDLSLGEAEFPRLVLIGEEPLTLEGEEVLNLLGVGVLDLEADAGLIGGGDKDNLLTGEVCLIVGGGLV